MSDASLPLSGGLSAKTYILLGPPGSGKSTQADFFRERFGAAHFDMGDALREAARDTGDLGRRVSETMNVKHALVPDDVMHEVLERGMAGIPAGAVLIVDGTPRRQSQIGLVESVLAEHGRQVDRVVFIELAEDESISRISKRFACEACGEKLILEGDVPGDGCPRCGGRVDQRDDDTPDGVRERYRIFHDETLPVLAHYADAGRLLRVSGAPGPEEIFRNIVAGIGG